MTMVIMSRTVIITVVRRVVIIMPRTITVITPVVSITMRMSIIIASRGTLLWGTEGEAPAAALLEKTPQEKLTTRKMCANIQSEITSFLELRLLSAHWLASTATAMSVLLWCSADWWPDCCAAR